jgi:hypothetical protein
MGIVRKIKSIGSKNISPLARFRKLKLTNFKTVNGLSVYTQGNNYVTKNRTPVTTVGFYNGKTRRIAYTTGKKISNNGYYGLPVFQIKSGGYFSSGGKGLYKHKNGKYYNYA